MKRKCVYCYRYKKSVDGEIYYCLDYEMNPNENLAEECPYYKETRHCMNCANRTYEDWGGLKPCLLWEQMETDEQERDAAATCSRYRKIESEYDEHYCPSATNGDYGPGNPWDAPGGRISDYI